MTTFVMAYMPPAANKRQTKRRDNLLDLPSNGVAMIYGRNSEGKIRVYARNLVHQPFVQVALFERYELADLLLTQLQEDDSFRRAEIREAKQLKPFKE